MLTVSQRALTLPTERFPTARAFEAQRLDASPLLTPFLCLLLEIKAL